MRRSLGLWVLVVAATVAACVLDRQGTRSDGAAASGGTATAQGAASPGGQGGTDTPTGTGASAAAGAGGQATGGEGAGALGGSGGAPGEDCLNGVDDNGDTLADCDDPLCTEFECVPAYPVAADYAFPVGATDPCPPPSTPLGLETCADCTCGTQAGTCSMTVDIYRGSGCSSYHTTKTVPGCYTMSDENRWYRASSSHDGNASCIQPVDYPPTSARACVLSSGGHCSGGEVCVPTNPNATARCVLLDGSVACSAPYTRVAVMYADSLTSCSCKCAPGAAGCTGGSVVSYNDSDSCGGGNQTVVPLDGVCHSGGWTQSYRLNAPTATFSCSAESAPTQQVESYTVCCLP